MKRGRELGTGSEQGGVGHIGEPKDGNIHGGRAREGEGLAEGFPGKARGDEGVVQDIGTVIERDESIMPGWPKEEEGQREREDSKEDDENVPEEMGLY